MKMQKTHKTGWLLSALTAALIATSADGTALRRYASCVTYFT